ncbi:MAG: amidase [Gemmatimonadetes bacterium]|nr:amidase [Gemmatimonadota bacterium]
MDDLLPLDALAQAELVRKGEVQAIELVEATIAGIERVNPQLNAVITPMYDQAREAAKGKLPDGPLAGVPYPLKDLVASYAGVRLASGAEILKDYVPDHDSELVIRLKNAGLIILCKTNTPEMGCNVTTEPRLFGPSRNPWDTTRTTGGSSGGSAALVAAGAVPAAHANDGAGSIRIPASCCGVFGLKPTRSRNPWGPDAGDWASGLAAEHAVTRSVRDSAALLDATSGPDVGDPYWAPIPERPFLEEVGTSPGSLRIAFTTKTLKDDAVHSDCADAVRDVAKLCADLGHEVVEASPAIDGEMFEQAFSTVFTSGTAGVVDLIGQLNGKTFTADQLEPLTGFVYEMGRGHSASDYLGAVGTIQLLAREIARFFVDWDVWLTPTLGEPPVTLGTFEVSSDQSPQEALDRVWQFIPFTPLCNATGQPAMSVPLYWNDETLPIGPQFIGRFGDEASLFRLAAQLEQARPWADRRPPVSVP